MTSLPTVAEFFAQYAEQGHIFPDGGLKVKWRDGEEDTIVLIFPAYVGSPHPIQAICLGTRWRIDGNYLFNGPFHADIIAVLDDAGEVIAGEAV